MSIQIELARAERTTTTFPSGLSSSAAMMLLSSAMGDWACRWLRRTCRSLSNIPLRRPGERSVVGLTACAGIAIVKSHYPFARAYALAEELTRSAKSYRTKETIVGSCLDWHFALSGLGGSIKEIRDREYKVRAGIADVAPCHPGCQPQSRDSAHGL